VKFKIPSESCHCILYPFHHTDKIIISDFDGTLTRARSDATGFILTKLHLKHIIRDGISEIFNIIVRNGYKIIYLTGRVINTIMYS
jgi:phosphatidate phosphatase PAH1